MFGVGTPAIDAIPLITAIPKGTSSQRYRNLKSGTNFPSLVSVMGWVRPCSEKVTDTMRKKVAAVLASWVSLWEKRNDDSHSVHAFVWKFALLYDNSEKLVSLLLCAGGCACDQGKKTCGWNWRTSYWLESIDSDALAHKNGTDRATLKAIACNKPS